MNFQLLTTMSVVATLAFSGLAQLSTSSLRASTLELGITDLPSLPLAAERTTVSSLSPELIKQLQLTNVGSVTSQGDTTLNANLARSSYNVDGSGIKIGIISDSFTTATPSGYSTNILSGDLPGVGHPNGYTTPVTILKDDFSIGTIDEGRAMAQIIHDIAPGAELYFHSAFNNTPGPGSLSSVAQAINNLVAAGVDIIVDDVAQLNDPFWQDGPSAFAANAAKAAGIPYFTSAGNQGNHGYIGTWNPMTIPNTGAPFHNFDGNANEPGGDPLLDILVNPFSQVRVGVQWTDPYPSLSTPAYGADFAVGLFDPLAGFYVSISDLTQDQGSDPWELVGYTNLTSNPVQLGVVIQQWEVLTPETFKIIVFGTGATITDDDDTNSPTIFSQAAADGAVAVAAHNWSQLSTVEPFSSQGPTTIVFNPDGSPTVEIRQGPEITAPDGVSTTVSGFSSFSGTSAAAPHAAAVAALMLERIRDFGLDLTPDELYNLLYTSTVDIETPGFDNLSGYGRLDAQLALLNTNNLIPEPATAGLLLFALTSLMRRRQRAI